MQGGGDCGFSDLLPESHDHPDQDQHHGCLARCLCLLASQAFDEARQIIVRRFHSRCSKAFCRGGRLPPILIIIFMDDLIERLVEDSSNDSEKGHQALSTSTAEGNSNTGIACSREC
jgi:hypothetical protein